jgi:thiamine pyrophosphate-dependent acetolactate synthase large subunit-like protein
VAVHDSAGVTTVAEAYLRVLKDRGVSRLFVNAGTDFAPLVEAYARQKQSGLDFPELVVCAHENLAISMAHGAYLHAVQAEHRQAVVNVSCAD